ncbi:hypothetical protein [Virgibacillus kimchii]
MLGGWEILKVTLLFLVVLLFTCEAREMDTIEVTSDSWKITYSEISNEDGVIEAVFNFTFIGEGTSPESISYKISQGSSFMNRKDFPF